MNNYIQEFNPHKARAKKILEYYLQHPEQWKHVNRADVQFIYETLDRRLIAEMWERLPDEEDTYIDSREIDKEKVEEA